MTPAARLLPMLSAADFDASVVFYRDLLGGAEAYRFPPEDPVLLTLRFGEAGLGIGATTDEPQPADQPWGERVAYVADPDGNLVMLATA